MYKVIEAANILGVSKVTVYKKIKILNLTGKNYSYKRGNATYLTELAVDKIRQSLIENGIIFSENEQSKSLQELNELIKIEQIKKSYLQKEILSSKRKYRNELRKLHTFLEAKIAMKNKQIEVRRKMVDDIKKFGV